MKKWTVCFMVAVFFVLWGMTLFATEAYFPAVSHTGYIGANSSGVDRPWYRISTDYMRLYGTQRTYKYTFTGTPTADRTVNFGNPAASSYVQYTATAAGGTSTYIPFYNASGQLAQDASFTYNSTTDVLTVYDASFTGKITVTGDVSGNSVHTSALTMSGLTSGRVVATTTGGLLTNMTMTSAILETLTPIYVEVSGAYTLTSTQMKSPQCTIVMSGTGADSSFNLPADVSGNLACRFQAATTVAAKWGVHSGSGTDIQVAEASGNALAAAGTYARYDQAVVGQSFKCWSQRASASTWGWVCKPEVVTTGRTFTDT